MSDVQSVIIVDDHPLFRKGLIQLLKTVPTLNLIGEAAGGEEGLALAVRLQPDLILLDLNMKDMNGIEVLSAIRAARLDSRVVMVTVSDHGEDLVAALRAGADGYLLKDMEPEAMVDALRDVGSGRIVISDELTHLMAAALRGPAQPESIAAAGLTEQEVRILEQISGGLSNKLI